MIEHRLTVATNGKPLDGTFFQILGFDILPDVDLNCYLLEINDHPSLDIYLDKEYMAGSSKDISKIDLYVKKKVVEDTIKISKKTKVSIISISYKSLFSYMRLNPIDLCRKFFP